MGDQSGTEAGMDNPQEASQPLEAKMPEISSSRFYDVEPIAVARLKAFKEIKSNVDSFAKRAIDNLPVTRPFPPELDRSDVTYKRGWGEFFHKSNADRTLTWRQERLGELVASDGGKVDMEVQERRVIDQNEDASNKNTWHEVGNREYVDVLTAVLYDPANPARAIVISDNRNSIELREEKKQPDGKSGWSTVAYIRGRADSVRQPEGYLEVWRDKGCEANLFDLVGERLKYLNEHAAELKPVKPESEKAPEPSQP
jgi:hypothetical protein